MQIIQFVFSGIIAICAVAMFVGAVITSSSIKVFWLRYWFSSLYSPYSSCNWLIVK